MLGSILAEPEAKENQQPAAFVGKDAKNSLDTGAVNLEEALRLLSHSLAPKRTCFPRVFF